ncbi:hypothetical protein IE53DRAFT_243384 [Violaceomyces palustris]|uniref:Uncharacterized protein n=1 Tax=Violaceomyces palustris TaxID=1673888 RepID=A0ACD0NP18_9BASI|nr:hypothetical protein IE53DRAFT_243384 [Violaceomyces palustris]
MSRDPYHDFASDLRSNLESAHSLSQSYLSLLSSSSSSTNSHLFEDDLRSAHDRLSDALQGLKEDLQDVQESVSVLQRSGPERFGVDPNELEARKRFVDECRQKIQRLEQIANRRGPDRKGKGKSRADFEAIDMGGLEEEEGENSNDAFEREQQQMLMAKQDSTLERMGSTLNTISQQAGMMGQEIGEQIDLLGALDSEVDRSQSRLKRAMNKMDDMVTRGDQRLGGWCVWILILVS